MQHTELFYPLLFYLYSFLFSLQVAPVCMVLAKDLFEPQQLDDGSLLLSAAMYRTGS
jgi:hypothetical protein